MTPCLLMAHSCLSAFCHLFPVSLSIFLFFFLEHFKVNLRNICKIPASLCPQVPGILSAILRWHFRDVTEAQMKQQGGGEADC